MKKTLKDISYSHIFLILFFIINLFFLTSYPFVHSDEAWLSGLTRNMIETKNVFTTEPFFNLYPRYPHSIKLFYHFIQMPFILIGGYSIFSVRLISLLFAIATLYMFNKVMYLLFRDTLYSLMITIIFSLNIQFIYAAHFARQEIILLFLLILGLYVYFIPYDKLITTKNTLLLGSIIGLCIGIHPNSFILALVFGCLYIYDCITSKKPLKHLGLLVLTVSCFALIFILLSFIGDSNFITHYTQYGSTFGVDSSLMNKLLTFDDFYYKLYHSISGTYYVPHIKYFWVAFIVLILISIGFLFFKSSEMIAKCLISLFAIQLGILFIGRYNSTSILFVIPFFYILLAIIIKQVIKKNITLNGLYILFIVVSLLLATNEIKPYLNHRYEDYLNEISLVVPKDAKVLGNLSAGFLYENEQLLDYRNLAYLKGTSFEEYIDENNITYIVYYEELDYIHNNPKWLVLYGVDDYYDDMIQYLDNHCTIVHKFNDELYGIRIPRYMFDYPWEVRVYRVNP